MINLRLIHDITVATAILAVSGALVWAMASDVLFYTIPNAVSMVAVVAYAVVALSMPPSFALGGVSTAAAVFVVAAALFVARRLGGGDVKLIASLSLWAGPDLLAPFALITSLAGLALSLFMLSPFRGIMPAASVSATAMTGSNRRTLSPMPFGVAIAAGGFYVLARRFAGVL